MSQVSDVAVGNGQNKEAESNWRKKSCKLRRLMKLSMTLVNERKEKVIMEPRTANHSMMEQTEHQCTWLKIRGATENQKLR